MHPYPLKLYALNPYALKLYALKLYALPAPQLGHRVSVTGKGDTCLKGGLTLHPLGNCLAQGSTILDKGRLECIADCINLARWI